MYETFEIESYKVRLTIMRYGDPLRYFYQRIIEITSQPQYHGIVIRAGLNFSNIFDLYGSTDTVVGWMERYARSLQAYHLRLASVSRILILVRNTTGRESIDIRILDALRR